MVHQHLVLRPARDYRAHQVVQQVHVHREILFHLVLLHVLQYQEVLVVQSLHLYLANQDYQVCLEVPTFIVRILNLIAKLYT